MFRKESRPGGSVVLLESLGATLAHANVHFVEHFQRRWRVQAHAVVIGQIAPANDATRVNQEFRGPRDVRAVDAAVRMQQIPFANDFRLRVAED